MYFRQIITSHRFREAYRVILIAGLIAVTLGAEMSLVNAAAQQPQSGILKGQVGVKQVDGLVVVPDSATVYILFSNLMEGRSFSHGMNVDTAGGQFTFRLNSLIAKNEDLKNVEKTARRNPAPEAADQIGTYYLNSVDEALADVRVWLTKHPDRTWQFHKVAPDGHGLFSAEDLPPGGYVIVVRGKFKDTKLIGRVE